MTDEEKVRGEVFALLSKWCGEVGECFNVEVSEHSPESTDPKGGDRPRRVSWYSGDSMGFSAEFRAMTWAGLLELMEVDPEGVIYQNEWDLSKPAAELMQEYED
jgi:hypothetical protein